MPPTLRTEYAKRQPKCTLPVGERFVTYSSPWAIIGMDDRDQPYQNTHSGDSTTDAQPEGYLLESINRIRYCWTRGASMYHFIKPLQLRLPDSDQTMVQLINVCNRDVGNFLCLWTKGDQHLGGHLTVYPTKLCILLPLCCGLLCFTVCYMWVQYYPYILRLLHCHLLPVMRLSKHRRSNTELLKSYM